MLKINPATILRTFVQNKFYAFINLAVLVFGMTSCFLIILYVFHQSTFDAHHKNAERIFRLTSLIKMGQGDGHTLQTPANLGPVLKHDNGFVEEYVRFNSFNFGSFKVKAGEKEFQEARILGADPQVFDVFTYPMLKGNPAKALTVPNSIVITESLARKYFDGQDPIGKSVDIDYVGYNVTAVIEDLPNNSDLNFNALISYDFDAEAGWDDIKYITYIKLKDQKFATALDEELNRLEQGTIKRYFKELGMDIETDFFFQPLRDVHFTSGILYDTPKANYLYVYLFFGIGLFILFITSFNYINLSAVQSFKRSNEVAVKGVFGARKLEIIAQFVVESFILTLAGLCISLMLIVALLPAFNGLVQVEISAWSLFRWHTIGMIVFVVLILGIISAIVPALYLTSFDLTKILKGSLPNFNKGFLYKCFLIGQFTMSVIMIVCTIAVYQQMHYMKEKDLGFSMDRVVIIRLPDELNFLTNTRIKKELSQYTSIKGVSLVGPASVPGVSEIEKCDPLFEKNGRMVPDVVNCIAVDENYLDVLHIELTLGRNFDSRIEDDLRHSFIVNEAFVRHMGWKDPIGKKIELHGVGKIIGVVKNYNYRSLHNEIEPLIMHYNLGGPGNEFLVNISSWNDVGIIKETWRRQGENSTLQISFLDSNFNKQYQQEEAAIKMFFLFSASAIFLACLGLFGLSSLITKQRIREIGIRKVLGGTSVSIIYVLLKEIFVLIFFSIIIAAPLAQYAILVWQQDFIYSVDIGFSTYLLAGVIAMVTTIVTASYHTVKAVNANPVHALRQA